jgi:hypothetical protein
MTFYEPPAEAVYPMRGAYPKASGRLPRWFLDSPIHDAGRT